MTFDEAKAQLGKPIILYWDEDGEEQSMAGKLACIRIPGYPPLIVDDPEFRDNASEAHLAVTEVDLTLDWGYGIGLRYVTRWELDNAD